MVKLYLSQTLTVNGYDLTSGCFFFCTFFLQAIPFGKLPVLEVDGVIIHQSLAMARYLAREAGNRSLTIFFLFSKITFNVHVKIHPQ